MEGECPLLLSLKRVEKLFNQKGTFGRSFYLIGKSCYHLKVFHFQKDRREKVNSPK